MLGVIVFHVCKANCFVTTHIEYGLPLIYPVMDYIDSLLEAFLYLAASLPVLP